MIQNYAELKNLIHLKKFGRTFTYFSMLYFEEDVDFKKILIVYKSKFFPKALTRPLTNNERLKFHSFLSLSVLFLARQFSPRDFILHLHPANRESQTCHWGFDVSHWRSYLHIQVRLKKLTRIF